MIKIYTFEYHATGNKHENRILNWSSYRDQVGGRDSKSVYKVLRMSLRCGPIEF